MLDIKQVLWSGGLDSTYLIWKLLSDGYKVEAYYVEIANNPEKIAREKAAIDKLLPLLKKYYFEYKGVLSTTSIEHIANLTIVSLPQCITWIYAAQFLAGPVSIGYVMNDDAISYLDDIRTLNTGFAAFRPSPLVLEFPLIKLKKEEIIRFMPKDLLKEVTWCESSNAKQKSKFCKTCHSCRRYRDAAEKAKKA